MNFAKERLNRVHHKEICQKKKLGTKRDNAIRRGRYQLCGLNLLQKQEQRKEIVYTYLHLFLNPRASLGTFTSFELRRVLGKF